MKQQRDRIRGLMIAMNKVDGLYYRASKKCGVKQNTMALIYALSDGKRHSQKQICEDWLIPRSTLNTIVSECVEAGYVTLTAMGNREKALSFTDAGKAYAEGLLRKIKQAEGLAMAKTAETYSEGFTEAFAAFAANLEEAFSSLFENEEQSC